MKPSIGRIVIYKLLVAEYYGTPKDQPREFPALVVNVAEERGLDLQVFTNDPERPLMLKHEIKQGTYPGDWHWPVIQKA